MDIMSIRYCKELFTLICDALHVTHKNMERLQMN